MSGNLPSSTTLYDEAHRRVAIRRVAAGFKPARPVPDLKNGIDLKVDNNTIEARAHADVIQSHDLSDTGVSPP
jgi:hypothetical protein